MQAQNPRKGKVTNTPQRDDPEQLALADRRMGRTPGERLRWVVRFTDQDLEALRPEERRALGFDLLMLGMGGWAPAHPKVGRGQHGYSSAMPIGFLPDDLLRSLQAEMAEGLRGLLQASPQPWSLPAPTTLSVSRRSPPGAKQTWLMVHWEGGAREVVLGSVLNLLLQAGESLKACAECGRPLVARKRQIYCSPVCSQRARDRKRPAKEV